VKWPWVSRRRLEAALLRAKGLEEQRDDALALLRRALAGLRSARAEIERRLPTEDAYPHAEHLG